VVRSNEIPASMPTQLGTFIGKHVYSNKLKTVHPDASQCCRFIDVKKSKEVLKGSSWIVRFCALCCDHPDHDIERRGSLGCDARSEEMREGG
jgi:hypothetical protein